MLWGLELRAFGGKDVEEHLRVADCNYKLEPFYRNRFEGESYYELLEDWMFCDSCGQCGLSAAGSTKEDRAARTHRSSSRPHRCAACIHASAKPAVAARLHACAQPALTARLHSVPVLRSVLVLEQFAGAHVFAQRYLADGLRATLFVGTKLCGSQWESFDYL